MSFRRLRHTWLPVVFLAVVAASAPAAEIDKYLPNDTTGLVLLNVRQVMDSPLFKKNYLPLLHKELQAQLELQKFIQNIGVDPFRDIDRLQLAFAESCEARPDKGEPGIFVVAHGRFEPARLHARLAELAPFLNKALQIHKSGNNIVYEVAADKRSFFFALPDRTTLVLAGRKEPVTEALERGTGKKKLQIKHKDFQDLIAKTDGKQALWIVATAKTALAAEQGKRKTLADAGVYEVSGGFWVTDGVKAAFGVKVQDPQIAKAVGDALQDELAKAIDKGFDGALDSKRLAPVREFLKEMVITGDGKHIVIQSEVPGRVFSNSLK